MSGDLIKNLAELPLKQEPEHAAARGGRLVVSHIPEASLSSWVGQKLWSQGVRNDVEAAGGA